jgi:hypothetical protein
MTLVSVNRVRDRGSVRWTTTLAGIAAILAMFALVGPTHARMTPAERAEIAKAEGWPIDPAHPDSLQKGGPRPIYRLDCTYVHNVGRLWVLMNNLGQIGEEFGDFYTNCLSAEWPAGSGNEYLFVAGPWFGAQLDTVPHVSTSAYQYEFRPSREEGDDVRSTYEGATGGNRVGGGSRRDYADDDGDGLFDEDFLNGKDDDGNNGIDEDFAAISQQMFAMEYRDDTQEAKTRYTEHVPLGIKVQQTSYAWSTAGTNDFIGVDYKFINVGGNLLTNVYIGFFVDGDIGPYSNPNLYEDDRFDKLDTLVTLVDPTGIGECVNRTFHLQMAYMWDEPDDPKKSSTLGGDVPGFAGTLLLGHTIDPLNDKLFLDQLNAGGAVNYVPKAPGHVGWLNVQYFAGTGGNPYSQGGDPSTDEERYDLLCAHNCLPDNPNKYANLRQAYRQPVTAKDYRYIISVGPFPLLAPDSSVSMSLAYVVGEGRSGLIENATTLLGQVWEGDWQNLDGDPLTGIDGRETCLINPVPGRKLEVDPDCVRRDSAAVRVQIKGTVCTAQNFVNADCDPLMIDVSKCTPNPKYPGSEYWRHWVSTTPPPPPNTNLRIVMQNPAFVYEVPYQAAAGQPGGVRPPADPNCPTVRRMMDSKGDSLELRTCVVVPGKDHEVVLQWDNASELIGNPIDHTDDFRGYRIWRAANWRRPVGTTSPERSQWELLADYARPEFSDTCLAIALRMQEARPVGYVFSDSICRLLVSGNDTAQAALADFFQCGINPYAPRYPFVNKGWLPCITDSSLSDTVRVNGVPEVALVQTSPQIKRAHFPVGRYKFIDNNVINGMPYFYAITAYRYSTTAIGKQELHSLAVATEADLVVPQSAAREDVKGIRVVPNPYIDHASWDLIPAPTGYLAPTGAKIEFQGLPRGEYKIRIFTLAGDLVKEITQDDLGARRTSSGATDPDDGTAEWNLVTRNGQDVTSGVYMYTVQAPGKSTVSGKMIIVRGKDTLTPR